MIRRLQQLPSQALGMRADRLPQGRRVLAQFLRKSGPQAANALPSLDNLAAAELAISQQLEGDPIRRLAAPAPSDPS
jgi:hypothetical protein